MIDLNLDCYEMLQAIANKHESKTSSQIIFYLLENNPEVYKKNQKDKSILEKLEQKECINLSRHSCYGKDKICREDLWEIKITSKGYKQLLEHKLIKNTAFYLIKQIKKLKLYKIP